MFQGFARRRHFSVAISQKDLSFPSVPFLSKAEEGCEKQTALMEVYWLPAIVGPFDLRRMSLKVETFALLSLFSKSCHH